MSNQPKPLPGQRGGLLSEEFLRTPSLPNNTELMRPFPSLQLTLSWENLGGFWGGSSYGLSAREAMMRLRWPSRWTFRTWVGGERQSGGGWAPAPPAGGPGPGCTAHVDELQLPEVLHGVHGAVATGQERVDVVLQPQGVQPGGHRWGAVPVTAQSLHLWARRV